MGIWNWHKDDEVDMSVRERDDIGKFIEIEVLITDIHLNEH
jgi:hypothetical protein